MVEEKRCETCRHRGAFYPWICYRDHSEAKDMANEKRCDNCRHRGAFYPWICYRVEVCSYDAFMSPEKHLISEERTCDDHSEAKDG